MHICFALECFASILGTLLLLPGNEIRLVTVVDKYFKAHSNHRQLHLCERSYFRHKVFLCICIFASAQQGQGGTRNFLSDNFPGAEQGGEEAPCGGGSVCYEWRPEVRGSLCLGGRLGLAVAVERGERSEGSACASPAKLAKQPPARSRSTHRAQFEKTAGGRRTRLRCCGGGVRWPGVKKWKQASL